MAASLLTSESFGALNGGSSQQKANAGLDLFYNPTPGVRANLTINTDFAQTEVDQRQVNLTRFSLFLPERRDFWRRPRPDGRVLAFNGRFETGGFYSGHRDQTILGLTVRAQPGYIISLNGEWNQIDLAEGSFASNVFRVSPTRSSHLSWRS
jgi:hypothetical protein